MGLDQSAFVFDTSSEKGREIAYWRKHPYLQGWMENLYREKGGTEQTFNCIHLELNLNDIDRLQGDVMNGRLPETTGFFFGTDASEHYRKKDLEFCEEARKHLLNGFAVSYYSWW